MKKNKYIFACLPHQFHWENTSSVKPASSQLLCTFTSPVLTVLSSQLNYQRHLTIKMLGEVNLSPLEHSWTCGATAQQKSRCFIFLISKILSGDHLAPVSKLFNRAQICSPEVWVSAQFASVSHAERRSVGEKSLCHAIPPACEAFWDSLIAPCALCFCTKVTVTYHLLLM